MNPGAFATTQVNAKVRSLLPSLNQQKANSTPGTQSIAAPINIGQLTLALPEVDCPPETEKVNSGMCVWPVKFHSQPNLSFEQVKTIAQSNGWTIATAKEVEDAWFYLDLDVYAFGRTADGNFSVPVQSDHSNFKIGANTGATGGNQGFFYTVGKAKRSIRKEQLPKIP